ncbi:hypothetical protein ABZ920_09740 [Streptomyces sp. NPDC046831]|uniref:hypothetical protein n=1 Tax=Streptomyces sp. NPDC046831 TaxID=3154805 RepID=UPI0033D81980
MSTPPDVHGGAPAGGTPEGPPNVYLPQPAATPSYEGYADPAVAHGWENAYDETSELAVVADDRSGAPAGRPQGHRGGRRGRRGKGRGGDRRLRGAALAAGAVGAVSLAVIAGFSALDSSSGPPRSRPDGSTPTAGESVSEPGASGAPASSAAPAAGGPSGDTKPSTASPGASTGASQGAPEPGGTSGAPETPAPSAPVTATASGPSATAQPPSPTSTSTDRWPGRGNPKRPK